MEFFRKTHIDFMGLRKSAAVFSIVLCLASIISVVFHGLNWGLDFTGGTEIQVSYDHAADIAVVRNQLLQAGFPEAVVQAYGNPNNASIRVGLHKEFSQQQLTDKVMQALPGATMRSVEFIGPQVGQELETSGFLALIISFVLTGFYIALRFEYRFAISSTVALIHDPIVILGIFSFFHIEFDLIALAAVLTVIGYSLNDTIVIFDRVRENFRKVRKATPSEIINLSVNQTLSRTIMTSGLTLVVVVALFIYGGPVVHGFSLALIIGIIVGTYSSIYVAGSLAVAMGLSRQDLLPPVKAEVDEMP